MSDQGGFVGLSRDALAFVDASLASNTRRGYDAQWRAWEAHARQEGQPALPATPERVANWLAFRAIHGTSAGRRRARGAKGNGLSVLRVALAAVRQRHAEKGLTFDSRHPAIRLLMQGIKRMRSESAHQSPALRVGDVERIMTGLEASTRGWRDGALIGVGFGFGLRRSELVGLDYQVLGSGSGVLSIEEDHIQVRIVRSKAAEPLSVATGQECLLTPPIAKMIRAWLAALAPQLGEPIFRRVHSSGRIGAARLTDHSAARVIRSLSRALGSDASAHGLRVGYAVSSFEKGADLIEVQNGLRQRSPLMAVHYARQSRRKGGG